MADKTISGGILSWITVLHTFKDNWCIGADQDSAGTSATYWTGTAFCVYSNIAGKYDSIPTVPRTALYPVDGIEESSSRAIAGIFGIKAFNVMIARRGKKVHEDGLDRLGLVNNCFGADVEASNGFGVNVVLAHQTGDD